jgi:hypothetical protein
VLVCGAATEFDLEPFGPGSPRKEVLARPELMA